MAKKRARRSDRIEKIKNSEKIPKYSDLELKNNRILRVSLKCCLKPDLRMKRISGNQVNYIHKFGVKRWSDVKTVFHDHCYGKENDLPFEKEFESNIESAATTSKMNLTKIARGGHTSSIESFAKPQVYYDSDIDSDIDRGTESDGDTDDIMIALSSDDDMSDFEGFDSFDGAEGTPYRLDEDDLLQLEEDENQKFNGDTLPIGNGFYEHSDESGNCTENDSTMVDSQLSMDEDSNEFFDMSDDEVQNDWEFLMEGLKYFTNDKPQNCDENGKSWQSIHLFGNVCLKSLRNQCNGSEMSCHFEHRLPVREMLLRNLDLARRQEIEEAHKNLLTKYDKLLCTYFPEFCQFYGRKNYREYLRLSIRPLSILNSINIATRSQLMREILNGFLITGMKYGTSVQIIINALDESLNSDDKFQLVCDILLDKRNTALKSQLQPFANIIVKDFNGLHVAAVDKLLQIQIDDETLDVRELTVNILKGCTLPTFRAIDDRVLTEYIWYLTARGEASSKSVSMRAKQLRIEN